MDKKSQVTKQSARRPSRATAMLLPLIHQVCLVCICGMVLVGLYATVQPVPATMAESPTAYAEPFRYYAETGHNVGGSFLDFYDTQGGIEVFGLPLTEAITDTVSGLTVQYFERARFELHPNGETGTQVHLTNLGTAMTAERDDLAFQPQTGSTLPGTSLLFIHSTRYFSETGHSLLSPFATFWEEHGGFPIFGNPISSLLVEEVHGQPYLVQYFERARLEYQAVRKSKTGKVRAGLLGREYLEQQALPAYLTDPAPAIVKLAEATTPYAGADSSGGHNVMLAAQHMHKQIIQPGEAFSFLGELGPITAEAGFVDGYGIVGDEIVTVIGGGVCQVSSVMYEVALEAGLEIAERHNHSYVLNFFQEQPGIEAAVYTDVGIYQDLRWRNDTTHPIYIFSIPDPQAGVVRVALWGVDDGRTVAVGQPEVVQYYSQEERWVLDEDMAEGTFEQRRAGVPGMDAVVWRQVQNADGTIRHEDRIVTHYKPLGALFYHGPGGNPNDPPTPTHTPEPTAEPTPEPESLVVEEIPPASGLEPAPEEAAPAPEEPAPEKSAPVDIPLAPELSMPQPPEPAPEAPPEPPAPEPAPEAPPEPPAPEPAPEAPPEPPAPEPAPEVPPAPEPAPEAPPEPPAPEPAPEAPPEPPAPEPAPELPPAPEPAPEPPPQVDAPLAPGM